MIHAVGLPKSSDWETCGLVYDLCVNDAIWEHAYDPTFENDSYFDAWLECSNLFLICTVNIHP